MSQQLEAVVAQIDDLQDGQMRQVSVGETDVLLVRLSGEYHALGAYCTHYQAPLVEGVLSENHVICPWHNAYFNLTTGDRQEPPGLDSLSKFPVKIDGDRVIVSVPKNTSGRRQPTMVVYDPQADRRTFVILGAGAAGTHAAETLRVAGYQGRIVMVTQDDRLPYDRTWLSKDYLTGKVTKEQMPLRSPQFYQQHQIEVLLNKQVVQVNTNAKAIAFANGGDSLNYDALLIATGGKPRQLDIPGHDLQNIFTLRSFADTDRILNAAGKAKRVVVIGSSFIGMEAASGLTQRGLAVTVVSPSAVPFEKILGAEIGQVFQQVHEENGVTFRMGRKVTQFAGDGKVETVVLDNGDRLNADLVVVGIGVQPATEFLQGLELHPKDNSVLVDEYLHAADGVYAAGDLARFPDWRTGELMRIEHWRVAAQHGRIAAYNMAGQPVKYKSIPIFWTMQFQFPLRYVGHTEQWDEIIFHGNLQQRQFIAFYVHGDRVLAAAASQRDTEAAAIVELMRLNQMPSPEELRHPDLDLVKLLQPQKEASTDRK